ncbi:hypothetical protein EI94DRAFT_1710958 [Lactarius quietus]|nr:hypothetical protein EI94DRAFT_1710958 [Lactarius quietus]
MRGQLWWYCGVIGNSHSHCAAACRGWQLQLLCAVGASPGVFVMGRGWWRDCGHMYPAEVAMRTQIKRKVKLIVVGAVVSYLRQRAMAMLHVRKKRKEKKEKEDKPWGYQDLATATAMTTHRDGVGRETTEGYGKLSPSWKDILWHAERRGRRGVRRGEWESEKGKEQR